MKRLGSLVWVFLACSMLAGSLVPLPAYAQNQGNGDLTRRLWSRLGRFRMPDVYERNHRDMRDAFRGVAQDGRQSTVRVLADRKPVALGTVVTSEGHVITKASEIRDKVVCLTASGTRHAATVVARDRDYDLALLKLDADELVPIQWSSTKPRVGAWLVTPSVNTRPRAIGVVSAEIRPLPAARAVLGVRLEHTDSGPRIEEIVPESAASRASLEIGDVILRLNGQPVDSPQAVRQTISAFRPGERIAMLVQRGPEERSITALLGELAKLGNEQAAIMEGLGGPLSTRRSGFPIVLQHDSVLAPTDCGGPLLDLDGRAVGINIARASRVASYAIPATVIRDLLTHFQTDLLVQDDASSSLHNASAN